MEPKTIFYILGIAVYVAYQLYTAAKKAKAKQAKKMGDVYNAPAPTPATRWQPQVELVEEPKTVDLVDYETVTNYETLKTEEEALVAFNNQSIETATYEVLDVAPTEAAYTQATSAQTTHVSWLFANGTSDYKKAIIWAEILKRPQWAN